ncbi:hypothetical protein MKX03_026101 [Papaver bracteatum]|nr:hypothetical protein MKX03_026101 [Papaver bracteatum]
MDYEDPIRHLTKGEVEYPCTVTRVFVEVQVRTKRVYRTRSGLLLYHLHIASPSQAGPLRKYLSSWRLFQIDFDDLLAKDVFRHCDANSLLSPHVSKNKRSGARFVNFFKRQVSSYCKRIAADLIETKPKFVVILTHITTVCVFDLDDDSEAEHSLRVCGKSCIIREDNPYGATLLPKGALLFSAVHGSMVFTDDFDHLRGQTCAICLDEFFKGSDVLRIWCEHAFHSRCLIPWFNKVGTCPLCRSIMSLYNEKNSGTFSSFTTFSKIYKWMKTYMLLQSTRVSYFVD